MENLYFQYLPSIVTVTSIVLIAIISPGPDFALTVKNSLVYSRRTGLFTALGISLGILIHVSYTLLGLGLAISQNPLLLTLVKYLGSCYLVYLGYKGIRAQPITPSSINNLKPKTDISETKAITQGFFTSALNPKSALFFISLFSTIIPSNTPMNIMLFYGIIIFIEALAWFSFIAFCLSGQRTRERFYSISYLVERTIGIILLVLACNLLIMEIKT